MVIETGIQYALMFSAIVLFAFAIPLAFVLGDKYKSPFIAGLCVLFGWGGAFIITRIILVLGGE